MNRNDTDSDKPDTDVNSGQKEQQTDREKLQICYVHVCGAVNQPGVYELTADSRLFEAIQMAGGLTEEAADQTQSGRSDRRWFQNIRSDERRSKKPVWIMAVLWCRMRTMQKKAGSTSDGKIDINTAAKTN